MITSQRMGSQELVLSPRNESRELRSNARSIEKGKAVAFFDGPPPPLSTLSVNEEEKTMLGLDTGDMKDWRRFREAGLLDEAALESKNLEALVEKVSKLQNELFRYQYNMGLLLMEKKEWASKNEDIERDLAETEEIIKREHSMHLMLLSEAEKREERIRKALASERQCVADLEQALRGVNEEHAENQLASKKKLAETNALLPGLEEKSLVVEENLCAAEAKLDEVNRKSATIELKMHEIDVRESTLEQEHMSLCKEKETRKRLFYKEREELRQWEQKLQHREENLSERRRIFTEREKKTNEIDEVTMQKEMNLEEIEKKIDFLSSSLISKEDEVNKKLVKLEVKEKEADSLRSLLETKQKDLLVFQEKLSRRERVEIEILLDNQREILQRKEEEFKLDWEDKREALDKELNEREHEIVHTEAETKHRAEKLVKREQALHEKSNRVKAKEKNLEAKLKTLVEKEKAMNDEDRKLETERQQMIADRDHLHSLVQTVEKLRAENTHLEQQIDDESGKLLMVREERSEYMHLELELRQEIGKYKVEKDLLLKEGNNLKQDRERFEKEWVILDEKRAEVGNEIRRLVEENEKVEQLHNAVHERIKMENDELQVYLQKELDDLKLQKESFAANTKRDHLALLKKAENEHNVMIRDFESQRSNLDTRLRNRKEEEEKMIRERDRALDEEKEREKTNMQCLKDIVQKEMEDVKSGRDQIENEKETVVLERKNLKNDQLEIKKDIDKLNELSKKLMDQRKFLVHERGKFLNLLEKLKNCENCGGKAGEFILNDIQLCEMDDGFLGNSHGNSDSPNSNSGGRSSWLRKCTSRIFNVSPSKKRDVPEIPLEFSLKRVEAEIQVQGPSLIVGNVPSVDDGSFLASQREEFPEDSGKNRRKYKSGLHRTRSVKDVVEDAKVFLRETPESRGVSRKRQHEKTVSGTERDPRDGENYSDSVTDRGRRKRRQTSTPSGPTPGQKRYNLRNTRARPSTNITNVVEKDEGDRTTNEEQEQSNTSIPSSGVPDKNAQSLNTNTNTVQISMVRNFEILENAPFVETTVINEAGDEEETSNQEDGEEYDESELIGNHPSISKKIWTFFTT